MSTSCLWCFKHQNSTHKCGACKAVYYCSKTCQKKDWQAYHKVLCPLIQKLKLEEDLTLYANADSPTDEQRGQRMIFRKIKQDKNLGKVICILCGSSGGGNDANDEKNDNSLRITKLGILCVKCIESIIPSESHSMRKTIPLSKEEVFEYMENHVLDKWKLVINFEIPDESEFIIYPVLSIPTGCPIFESANPKPKYYTFIFAKLRKYPGVTFMVSTDRDEGAIMLFIKNNDLRLSSNCAIIGKELAPDGVTCHIDDEILNRYSQVEWNTGGGIGQVNL
jgi:hypothetical protein